MTCLTNLPDDLQFMVFEDLSQEDLLSLVKTHRAFKAEAQRRLFRTVLLPVQSLASGVQIKSSAPGEDWIDHHGPMNPHTRRRMARGPDLSKMPPVMLPADQEQMMQSQEIVYTLAFNRERTVQRFLEAITSNSMLATFVRHLKLHAIWGGLNVFHTGAFAVLDLLPNLRDITVSVADMIKGRRWKDVQVVCAEWLWRLILKSGIKIIRVHTGCFPIMNKILHAESLQEFEYVGCHHVEPHGELGPTDYGRWLDTPARANLKSINLGYLELHGNSLKRLCSQATALTHLSVCHGRMMKDAGAFPGILEGIQNTLQSLEVLRLPWQSRKYDICERARLSGIADFKNFRSLRSLKIFSELWFNLTCRIPSESNLDFIWNLENRMGAYQYLPASIEDVEVQFNGLFGYSDMYQLRFMRMPAEQQMKGYDWILEFAQNRHALPNLKSLRVYELPHIPVDTPYKNLLAHYQPPELVQESFDNAKLGLRVDLLHIDWKDKVYPP